MVMVSADLVEEIDYGTLTAGLAEACGVVNAAQARLVELASVALKTGAWQVEGIHDAGQWLAWQCGLSPQRGRALAEVAGRVDELPITFEAFRRGELSFDQWGPVARHAPAWADQEACDFAKALTVSQLSGAMRNYAWPVDPDAEQHNKETYETNTNEPDTTPSPVDEVRKPETEVDEQLWLQSGDDGCWRLGGTLAGDHGELVNQALSEARDHLFRDGQQDVTWVDALVEVCNRSLDTITSPARRDRYRVHLHLQLPDTPSPIEHSASRDSLAGLYGPLGHRLPDELRDYLTCDVTMTPVWERDGIPISIGHSKRTVPDRTRRTVMSRDKGCRVPGCTHDRWLDVHHIVHYADGGSTDTWNLVCLCKHHHRLHHRGLLGITGNANLPDGLVFTNQHGRPLIRPTPTPPTRPLPEPEADYTHPSGEQVRLDDIYFNPPQPWRTRLRSTAPQVT